MNDNTAAKQWASTFMNPRLLQRCPPIGTSGKAESRSSGVTLPKFTGADAHMTPSQRVAIIMREADAE